MSLASRPSTRPQHGSHPGPHGGEEGLETLDHKTFYLLERSQNPAAPIRLQLSREIYN